MIEKTEKKIEEASLNNKNKRLDWIIEIFVWTKKIQWSRINSSISEKSDQPFDRIMRAATRIMQI